MKKSEVPSVRLIALEQDMAKYKPTVNELGANAVEVSKSNVNYFCSKLKNRGILI